MNLSRLLMGAVMAGFLAVGAAHATEFDFSFSGDGFSGSGVFDVTGSAGAYTVVSATGTASDSTYNSGASSSIVGLNNLGDADNLLYYPDASLVDIFGIGISTADGNQYNIFEADDYMVGDAASLNDDGGGGGAESEVAFSVTPLSAVTPEPASWGLMVLGLGFLGIFAYRRRGNIAFA